MPMLRRTYEFPASVHIEPVKWLCGYGTSRRYEATS
jgi:hypothetical protein